VASVSIVVRGHLVRVVVRHVRAEVWGARHDHLQEDAQLWQGQGSLEGHHWIVVGGDGRAGADLPAMAAKQVVVRSLQ
jgi:hypothetical protein